MIRFLTSNDIKQAIFGVSDGLTSSLGVVIPLSLLHKPLFAPLFGLAICAGIGMAGGEFLSDETRNIRGAVAMLFATVVGTLMPGLPFLFLPPFPAAVVMVILAVIIAVAISEFRARESHGTTGVVKAHVKSYATTFGILLAASAATLIFVLLTQNLSG